MSFPLQQAKFCLDCNMVFAGGNAYCIACGSISWVWLAKYIKDLKDATEHVPKGEPNEKQSKITTSYTTITVGGV
jgi:hypothetical protein